jgi:hypothetical protein
MFRTGCFPASSLPIEVPGFPLRLGESIKGLVPGGGRLWDSCDEDPPQPSLDQLAIPAGVQAEIRESTNRVLNAGEGHGRMIGRRDNSNLRRNHPCECF